jgi:hypothetical protein
LINVYIKFSIMGLDVALLCEFSVLIYKCANLEKSNFLFSKKKNSFVIFAIVFRLVILNRFNITNLKTIARSKRH